MSKRTATAVKTQPAATTTTLRGDRPYCDWSLCSSVGEQNAAAAARAAIVELATLPAERLAALAGEVRLVVRTSQLTGKLGQPAKLVHCGEVLSVRPADDGVCAVVNTSRAGEVKIRVRYQDTFAGARPHVGAAHGHGPGADWSL